MRREYLLCVLLVVAGCATGESLMTQREGGTPSASLQSEGGVPRSSCEGQALSQCKFINSPVKLSSRPIRLPGDPYPYYKTRNTLKFVDATNGAWVAPAGILTDGASIPPMFVPFIGDPRSRQFMNAATVHDAYCARANRDNPYYHAARWQDVHRMFYDALLVSGTPPVKAKIMYAAVYLGGPRWPESEIRKPPRQAQRVESTKDQEDVRLASTTLEDGLTITPTAAGWRAMQSSTPLPQLLSKKQLIEAFKRARDYIRANNPPIADVEIHLTQLEMEMTGKQDKPVGKRRNFRSSPFAPDRDLGGEDGGGEDGGSEQ